MVPQEEEDHNNQFIMIRCWRLEVDLLTETRVNRAPYIRSPLSPFQEFHRMEIRRHINETDQKMEKIAAKREDIISKRRKAAVEVREWKHVYLEISLAFSTLLDKASLQRICT